MRFAPLSAHANDGPPPQPPSPETAGIIPWIALGLLAALQAALILTHVAWRDELQALMLAQHSASLGDLFANLHYEGHPALWYLLLRAFSPLGGSPETLKIVQLAVALSTIAIVWTRAPFRPSTKLLILASYPILFEWGTIARSYGLGVTLFFAFLTLRRHWSAYLVLGLMANISVHFLILSGICLLTLIVIERRASMLGIGAWIVGCLAAIATAFPVSDVETVEKLPALLTIKVLSALETISYALVPIDPRFMPPHWTGLSAPASALVGLLVAAIGWFALARNRRAGGLYLLFFAAMFLFGAFVHPTATRHTAMLFLCLVGLEWVLAENAKGSPSILTRAWAAVLVPPALWIAAWSFAAPFTPLGAIVALAQERGLADAQWAAYPASLGVDLAANLDRPFYDPQKQCLAWFQKWDAPVGAALDPRTLNDSLVRGASAFGGRLLLLSDNLFDAAAVPDLSLEATFPADFLMETWYVYAVNAPTGEASPAPAACE